MDDQRLSGALQMKRFRNEAIAVLSAGLFTLGFAVLIDVVDAIGWLTGYLLGLAAVFAHLLAVLSVRQCSWNLFLFRYYIGLVVRFLLVLSIFALLLAVTNIDQISFTLSFIISYIFHSVVDVILIHKTGTNETDIIADSE